MNGFSAESGWPSQAPNPMSSWRLSSSSNGVNVWYQSIDASMLLTLSAMCVQRASVGRSSYVGVSVVAHGVDPSAMV